MRGKTLSQQILSANDGSIFFRTDFPQYHPESVGRTLSGLVEEGSLVRIASGIYLKPKQSKFGAIMPSVDQIVRAIAERDKAQVLPSGGHRPECSWAVHTDSDDPFVSDNRECTYALFR